MNHIILIQFRKAGRRKRGDSVGTVNARDRKGMKYEDFMVQGQSRKLRNYEGQTTE